MTNHNNQLHQRQHNQHPSPLSHLPKPQPSILNRLRDLIPNRPCEYAEALSVAERQATRLHQLLLTTTPSVAIAGIHAEHLTSLPRITVAYEPLPVSGMSHWNGREWIICLNQHDPEVRQRFTLLHEFKHIIDHGRTAQLYAGDRRATPHEQAERAADYFAGCALIPRTALKHAWGNGLQHPTALAEHFGVSQAAIDVRLDQTGYPEKPTQNQQSPKHECGVRGRSGQQAKEPNGGEPPALGMEGDRT